MTLVEFMQGPGKTALGEEEILLEVECAALPKHGGAFEKVGHRRSLVISTVCVAALVELDPSGESMSDVRLAVGGVGPVPRRVSKIEAALKSRKLTSELLEEAAATAAELVASRSRQEYRREVVQGFVLRALVNASRRAGASEKLITREIEARYA
jgi:CO/xanthine dehydrogenase FAD-binding subunit